jgi:hypothetical protein
LIAALRAASAFVFIAMMAYSCAIEALEPRQVVDTALLVYMAGANSLDRAGIGDIEEMMSVDPGLLARNRVLILYDRMERHDGGPEDWAEARLLELLSIDGRITLRELPCPALGLSTEYIDDALDTGSAAALAGFIGYAEERYAAGRTHLDIWSHGSGWLASRGIAFDDEAGSMLSVSDLEAALSAPTRGFGIVMLDACFMATVEVASAFRGKTDYLVASQDEVPFHGLPYGAVLPILLGAGTDADKAVGIAQAFSEAYNDIADTSMSVIRIDADNGYSRFVSAFANHIEHIDQDFIRASRASTTRIHDSSVDFGVFADGGQEWAGAIDALIAYREGERAGANIFFPEYFAYDPLSADYTQAELPFLRDLPYREWLQCYSHTGVPWSDTFEPNGNTASASPLGSGVRSKIWCSIDRDYFSISFAPGARISLSLESPAGCDYDMRLSWTQGGIRHERASVLPSSYWDEITIGADESALFDMDSIHVLVFSSGGSYSQILDYSLSIDIIQ